MPEIRVLEPPLHCIMCGRLAQYVCDGTSYCQPHAQLNGYRDLPPIPRVGAPMQWGQRSV